MKKRQTRLTEQTILLSRMYRCGSTKGLTIFGKVMPGNVNSNAATNRFFQNYAINNVALVLGPMISHCSGDLFMDDTWFQSLLGRRNKHY